MAEHFTKTLQGDAFRKFRSDIQGIPEDTPDTHLGWDIPEETFIPIPQECVDRSERKTDIRTNKSRDRSTVECIKSRDNNPVVHMVEGSPTEHSKTRKSTPVVRMVSYANIARRNILTS